MNSFNYPSFFHVAEIKPSICILDHSPLCFFQGLTPSDITSFSYHLNFSFFISPLPLFYKHSFIHSYLFIHCYYGKYRANPAYMCHLFFIHKTNKTTKILSQNLLPCPWPSHPFSAKHIKSLYLMSSFLSTHSSTHWNLSSASIIILKTLLDVSN